MNTERPVESGDTLANLIDAHKPVTNSAGRVVGCQCRDVIGFPNGETWADHLAAQVGETLAVRIEVYAERRAKTAHQTWFNPIAGARAQGRVAGLDQAAQMVRDLSTPPGKAVAAES